MGLTKSQLEQLNNSSFPNNNSGYITPELLRTFNSSSIAATVNQDAYTTDSASFDTRIDSLENFSSSLVTNFATVAYVNSVSSSLVSTASFNSYTASTAATIAGLATTSSVNALTQSINNNSSSIGLLQTFSGSQYKADSASFDSRIISAGNTGYVTTASFNSYTASTDTKINSLNTISASYLAFTQSYYSDSASVDSRLKAAATTGSNTFSGNQIINGNVSASSFVSASKFVGDGSQLSGITASVSIAILDEGVYQGNATSLNFTGSGLTASVVAGVALIQAQVDQSTLNQYTLTSSFNSFTQSYQTDSASFNSRINSITGSNVNTASFVTTSSFNAYTQSNDSKVNALIAATGSYITNSQTSSMAVSSSTYAITSSYAINAQTASEARNLVVIARNGNQSTLSAGTVVHITGASGDNPIFNTASYDNEALSSNTFGILRSTLTSGADGEVVVNGIVTGVNTDPADGWAAGSLVYLGANGAFTRTQPQAPLQIVTLGQVLRAQQNNGSIYVSINNGWELNELHNVQINTPLTNDILAYESSSYGLWKNKSISSLGLTTTSSFNSFTASYQTDSASFNNRIDGKINGITVLDESSIQGVGIPAINFLGAGVSVAITGTTASVTISGTSFNTGSFATTGSNSFVGDQLITGSVIISSSAATDLLISGTAAIVGTLRITGSTGITNVINVGNITISSGSNSNVIMNRTIGFYNTSGSSQIGITAGTTALGSIPSIFASSGSGLTNYVAIKFEDGSQYTDGRVTFVTPLSASAGITSSNAFINGALYSVTSASFDSRINAITSSATINTGSFITTGSVGTGSQTILGDFNFNTTYTGSEGYTNQAGGTNVLGIDYGAFGPLLGYWGSKNFTTIVVNGTGVTNATVTSYNFGSYLELTLSSGTTTNGATYTLTGPAIQDISITGSLQVTEEVKAVGASGEKAVMDVRGFYSLNSDSTIQAGASTDGGVYTNDNSNGNGVRLAISSSQVSNGVYNGAQIAVNQNNAGTFTQIGFEGNNNYTDGTITIYQPLFVSKSLSVSGSATFSQLTGSLASFSASVNSRINAIPTINTSSFATTGSNTFIGTETISGSLKVTGSVAGNVAALSVASSTASIDLSTGTFFTLTIPSSSVTFITATNITPGITANIVLTQQSTTGSVRFDSMFKFPSGSINTGSAVASAVDMVSVMSVGTTTLYSAGAKNLV